MYSTTLSIHCLGDSITEASGLPECARWTVTLQHMLNDEVPGTYMVFNHGVGGNTSAQGMDRMRNDVIGKDITLIEFGLNDCSCQGFNVKNRVGLNEYVDNLRAMATIVRQRSGRPVLVANHLPDYVDEKRQPDGKLYSDKIRLYNEGVRALAAELHLPLIDMEAQFTQRSAESASPFADGLHLNSEGNRFYAQVVHRFLKERVLISE